MKYTSILIKKYIEFNKIYIGFHTKEFDMYNKRIKYTITSVKK